MTTADRSNLLHDGTIVLSSRFWKYMLKMTPKELAWKLVCGKDENQKVNSWQA
jgi:hypothetical protein